VFDIGQSILEVHVDLLPVFWRAEERFTSTVTSTAGDEFKVGGKLSTRMPEGVLPIIEVGFDETMFKMYQMNRSAWEMDQVRRILRKTDGKGVMFAVFKDEVCGLGYNLLTDEQWEQFKIHRAALDDDRLAEQVEYLKPNLHLHEYGANAKGYWTAKHMVRAYKGVHSVI
jgi:hypothetical protein